MASKERPRSWLPLDVDFFSQDSICDLGEEFGPAGPLVFLSVLAEAKRHAKAGSVPVSKQGTVELRYRAVARTAFLRNDVETVRRIIEACVGLGLLEMLSCDETRFQARLAKWRAWEAQDSGAAERKQRSRGRAGAVEAVEGSEEESDDDDDYIGRF